jgi:hypothetical protein
MRVSFGRRALLAALACLALGAGARADDFVVPAQKITGAEQPIPLGELVDLGLTPLKEKPKGLEGTSAAWRVIDLASGQEKKFREHAEGIFFGAGIRPKKLKVFCAVSYLFVARDGDKVKSLFVKTVLLTADVQVGEPGPGPGPEPGPVPPPSPPDPWFPKLKAAFDQEDAASRHQAGQLAAVYEEGAKLCFDPSLKLVRDVDARIDAAASSLIQGSLPKVRAAISECLNSVLPRSTKAPLDDPTRALCARELARVGKLLRALK